MTARVKVRREPGAWLYWERGGSMVHAWLRRLEWPYGDGRTWTCGLTLRAADRYLLFRRGALGGKS